MRRLDGAGARCVSEPGYFFCLSSKARSWSVISEASEVCKPICQFRSGMQCPIWRSYRYYGVCTARDLTELAELHCSTTGNSGLPVYSSPVTPVYPEPTSSSRQLHSLT